MLNKVQIIGRLGADPEVKYTQGNRAVCNLNVATKEVFKDKAGQRQERTEWHRVTVWGEQAEHCSKYLSKGRSVYVEGRLQTRSYEKDGQKHYATDIVAERVQFLDGKPHGDRQEKVPPPASQSAPAAATGDGGDGDEIPF